MILVYIGSITLFFILSILLWFLVGYKWGDVSSFFHSRYDYFDFSFILLYFVEQLCLFYLVYLGRYNLQIILALFSLIIITTVSLQNKCWECRTKKIGKLAIGLKEKISGLIKSKGKILKDNNNLEVKVKIYRKLGDDLFKQLKKLNVENNKLKSKKPLKKKK